MAAAGDPSAPLLAGDTLHGYADVPIGLPVFRVLYRRNELPPPPLAELEERLRHADNPG